jgi:hypothetical protein
MTLREKQSKFVLMIADLVQWAYRNGYELTYGDAYAQSGHRWNSNHYKRLAVDFNLFIDGIYQEYTDAYKPLGEYWESIGGAWGGRFNDGNHFSLEHKGVK